MNFSTLKYKCAECKEFVRFNREPKSLLLLEKTGEVLKILELGEEDVNSENSSIELNNQICINEQETVDKYTCFQFALCRNCRNPLGKFYLSSSYRTISRLRKCFIYTNQLIIIDQDKGECKSTKQSKDYSNLKNEYKSSPVFNSKQYINIEEEDYHCYNHDQIPQNDHKMMDTSRTNGSKNSMSIEERTKTISMLEHRAKHSLCKNVMMERVAQASKLHSEVAVLKERMNNIIHVHTNAVKHIQQQEQRKQLQKVQNTSTTKENGNNYTTHHTNLY